MTLEEAVREALERIPCSERALAIRAGVSPATLTRVKKGTRGVSPDLVRRLADALGGWTEDCAEAERALRQALNEEKADE